MSAALIILILCILINSLIGVVFKLYNKYDIHILYAIVINYAVCVITGSIFFGRFPISIESTNYKWFPIAVGLGFVFVLVFNLYAHTVKHFGIVISTIFQKMSMIAPALIAILYYAEQLTFPKGLGILLGIFAIAFLSMQKKSKQDIEVFDIPLHYWLLPLGTLIGSCLIDSSLFLLEAEQIAPSGDISFVIHLFFFAFLAGLILVAIDI